MMRLTQPAGEALMANASHISGYKSRSGDWRADGDRLSDKTSSYPGRARHLARLSHRSRSVRCGRIRPESYNGARQAVGCEASGMPGAAPRMRRSIEGASAGEKSHTDRMQDVRRLAAADK